VASGLEAEVLEVLVKRSDVQQDPPTVHLLGVQEVRDQYVGYFVATKDGNRGAETEIGPPFRALLAYYPGGEAEVLEVGSMRGWWRSRRLPEGLGDVQQF
jgi:hypothetical protein